MNDYQVLTAGKATFTLEGMGRRWTYRIARSQDGERYFAKLLTGTDNEGDYTYLGVLDPDAAQVRLTRASRMNDQSEPVRALRWVVSTLHDQGTDALRTKGFRLLWSSRCARCGRTLTVPSSIDSRLGPECAKHFS